MQSAQDLFASYHFSTSDYKGDERAKLILETEKLFLEKERIAHSRWWQEDALVNNRLTWLLQSQVVLFAAYGFLARTDGKVPVELKALVAALPWLGFAVCVVIALGVRAAWRAQRVLSDQYSKFGIVVGVDPITTTVGRIPGYVMPLIFAGGWGWLFKSYCGAFLSIALCLLILLLVEQWLTRRSRGAPQAALPWASTLDFL